MKVAYNQISEEDIKVLSNGEYDVLINSTSASNLTAHTSIKRENALTYNYYIKKSNENMDIEFDNKTLNFVTVARLVPQKAIDRIIDVHTKLIQNGFEHNWRQMKQQP